MKKFSACLLLICLETGGSTPLLSQPFVLNGTSAVYTAGNVGVGTTRPETRLTVLTRPGLGGGPRAGAGKVLSNSSIASAAERYGIEHTDGTVRLSTYIAGDTGMFGTRSNHPLQFFTNDSGGLVTIDTAGRLGVGTEQPLVPLEVRGKGITEAAVRSINERAVLSLHSTLGGTSRDWTLESGVFGMPGLFGIFDRQRGRAGLTIDTAGLVAVEVLQIKGGSDLSENFDISPLDSSKTDGLTNTILPGSLVSIDPDHPGRLMVSTQAYDHRVAGVVSGAGGVRPGLVMTQEGSLASGAHPVALTGRVYCFADACYSPIVAGDLLTTSITPGHAMAATERAQAQGSVIGKAMTSLPSGRGLVLVLVTLQ